MKLQRMAWLWLATTCFTAAHGAQPTLEDFTRDSEVAGAELSPDGKHIALRVLNDGLATLQIRSVPDFKLTGTFGIAGGNEVGDFYWKNDERLLVGVRRRLGTLGKPEYTGSLIAVNMDGRKSMVVSQRSRINELDVSGDIRDFEVVDPWINDHDHVLINRYESDKGGFVLQNCNVYVPTCKQLMMPRLPRGSFWTDSNGEVRGQSGSDDHNKTLLIYRDPVSNEWKDFDSFYSTAGGMLPSIFDPQGKWVIAFDDREDPVTGVYKVDLATRQHELLYRDALYDAEGLILGTDRAVIGASWEAERQRWTFFDGAHPDAALYTALRKGLGNVSVYFMNFTRTRDRVLLRTESDVAPPTYYVVDLKAKSILMRIPTRPWIDPAQMAPRSAISFQARDGLTIRGYLTLPKQAAGSKAPLIVLPHGGPHGVRDYWEFDSEVQLLANHGYAVLQVNYRGSGGYGREFQNRGYRQWGRAMQDDITDGTKWAAQRADIDGTRMCIYGASYGAYAALMGVQRDPGLFRCAAGYVGVYDLEMMWNKGDTAQYVEGRSYLKLALGDDSAELKARSPVNFADAVQVPVFLAHGKEDERAPVKHLEAMRDALQKAGKPVETLVKDNEGHGFYNAQNRLELYTKMLAFFDRNLGMGAAAK